MLKNCFIHLIRRTVHYIIWVRIHFESRNQDKTNFFYFSRVAKANCDESFQGIITDGNDVSKF